jgi:hypothetical protein
MGFMERTKEKASVEQNNAYRRDGNIGGSKRREVKRFKGRWADG